jgi:hypothetical protein
MFCALVAFGYPASAGTYYVGTCHTGSFPTITAAVNSSSVAAGSVLKICPGFYVEQVIISKPLTLQGIAANGISQVEITPPSPNPITTTTSPVFAGTLLNETLAPIVWVTTGPVNIQNISVMRAHVAFCPTLVVGFYYASGASGTLSHVATYADQTDQRLCGVGIWAENADVNPTAVTIQNSLSDSGIVAGSYQPPNVIPVMSVNITGNQIFETEPRSIGAYGIYLRRLFATVSGNFVTGPPYYPSGTGAIEASGNVGIMNDGASSTITGNTLVFNDYTPGGTLSSGIVSNVGGTTVKSNKISGATYAILLACSPFDVVSGNIINSADNGISNIPVGIAGVNTFFNTFYKLTTC